MIQSRRDFFRFAAGATSAALPWPLMGLDSYSLNQSGGSKAGAFRTDPFVQAMKTPMDHRPR